ncbi:hypothetical protein GCM10008957_46850 [Deinococcus ruber]|uniref:Uncharacterized protein n=1 Tax=Deinococcus ruber TaxID=1848197 RepID=A0A918FCJ6_9DEIO|nr:hypothetical protein GCM10008957_46850 [Deinococcus ruber]
MIVASDGSGSVKVPSAATLALDNIGLLDEAALVLSSSSATLLVPPLFRIVPFTALMSGVVGWYPSWAWAGWCYTR